MRSVLRNCTRGSVGWSGTAPGGAGLAERARVTLTNRAPEGAAPKRSGDTGKLISTDFARSAASTTASAVSAGLGRRRLRCLRRHHRQGQFDEVPDQPLPDAGRLALGDRALREDGRPPQPQRRQLPLHWKDIDSAKWDAEVPEGGRRPARGGRPSTAGSVGSCPPERCRGSLLQRHRPLPGRAGPTAPRLEPPPPTSPPHRPRGPRRRPHLTTPDDQTA